MRPRIHVPDFTVGQGVSTSTGVANCTVGGVEEASSVWRELVGWVSGNVVGGRKRGRRGKGKREGLLLIIAKRIVFQGEAFFIRRT